MAICPHCGQDMGSNPAASHFCGERYYVEICPGTYQCTICGNIQEHTGNCSHCGALLDCFHEHCPCCGCCIGTCHCSCCCY